jgi:hypothetical protein
MQTRAHLTFLLILAALVCRISVIAAQPAVSPTRDIPETYEVVTGDTLWDITMSFFGDPYQWPDIWKKNLEKIEDPHWIYPGQIINLRELMQVLEEPEPEPEPEPSAPLAEPEPVVAFVAPRLSEPLQAAMTAVDMPEDTRTVIRTLDEPRLIYTDESFMRSGFITRRSELPRTRIVEIESESSTATTYDTVFIDAGEDGNIRQGDRYALITVEDRVKHPDTGEDMGVVARVKGIMTIEDVLEKRSRGRITNSFDPVTEGDLVLPYTQLVSPLFDAWVEPETQLLGTIIAENEPLISIHVEDILYIDLGSDHGVQPGDRFFIYGSDDPDRIVSLGMVQVVGVRSAYSGVVVTRLTGKQLAIGNEVVLVERCRLAR